MVDEARSGGAVPTGGFTGRDQSAPSAGGDATPGLQVRVVDSWADLVTEAVADIRTSVPDDPFAMVPVVVRGAAARRALSQAVASATGTGGVGGVCAGVSFISLGQLRRQLEEALLDQSSASDPWRRRALALTVLKVLQSEGDAPWFTPLALHLTPSGAAADPLDEATRLDASRSPARPGRWLATAERIAALLGRYAQQAPDLLRHWSQGLDVDLHGDPLPARAQWQPHIWRQCQTLIEQAPDPVARHDLLVGALHDADPTTLPLPARVLVLDPGPLTQADNEFLEALAQVRPVCLTVLRPASASTPWGRRLGLSARTALERWQASGARMRLEAPRPNFPDLTSSDPSSPEPNYPGSERSSVVPSNISPSSVLGALQTALSADPASSTPTGPGLPDGSVQVHASHGPDRQVEVLRDVLCALFDEDPSLEPRDVVVLCPNLERFAPLVRAAFGTWLPDDDPAWSGTLRHPATRLRVQVSGSSVDEPNPALALLRTLLALPTSRATGQDLLDLCANPVVAARFGLEPADLDLLARLLAAAEVRWGVDAAQRAFFGLDSIRQSTWMSAIDRLLVGAAMGDQPPGSLDTVAPVPMIGSRHVEVVGALAEIVSRVRRLLALWSPEATMSQWVDRLREGLDQLATRSGPHAATAAHARAQLAQLADLTHDSPALVSRGDLRGQFDRLLRPASGRPTHGNGSLLVTRLGDLDDISHRVVVLLGLDDGTVPPPARHDGDDLVPDAATPETGVREVSLRHVHEALRAARDTLVVVHQGFDPRTNEPVPEAPVLGDLIDACRPFGGVTARRHTLLAESMGNFLDHDDEPAFSFDPVALRGARALDRRVSTHLDDGPPEPHHSADAANLLDPPAPGQVELADLVTFLRNPAAALLLARLGVSLGRYTVELDPELPIEADGLVRWRLGEQFLAAALAGTSLDEVERLARLGGDLPPGHLADRAVDQVKQRALGIAAAVMARTTVPGARERLPVVDRRLRLDLRSLDAGVLVGQTRTINDTIVTWRFGRTRLIDLLDSWIHLAALQAEAPAPSWRAVCVGTDGVSRLRPPDPDAARGFLAELVQLRAQGLRQVVPLPLEVVQALTDLDPGAETWGRARDEQREAQQAWNSVREKPEWRMTLDLDHRDLMRLPPLPTDPGRRGPNRLEQLQHWLVTPMLDHLDREAL